MIHRLIDRVIEFITPDVPVYNPDEDQYMQLLKEQGEGAEREVARLRSLRSAPDGFIERGLFPDNPARDTRRDGR
jgi:hypothetical protein